MVMGFLSTLLLPETQQQNTKKIFLQNLEQLTNDTMQM